LTPNQHFERAGAKTSELVPLAAWKLGDIAAQALTPLNDMAFGEDERVYVISSDARAIARLEKGLEPGEKAGAKAFWTLDDQIPGGDKAKPEGLGLLPGMTPVVGFDSKRAGNNLVILERGDGVSTALRGTRSRLRGRGGRPEQIEHGACNPWSGNLSNGTFVQPSAAAPTAVHYHDASLGV